MSELPETLTVELRPERGTFRCPVCAMPVVQLYEWPESQSMTLTTACSERWKWRDGDKSLTVDNPQGTGPKCRAIAAEVTTLRADLELALDAIDDAMAVDKMNEEEHVEWCNQHLALMKRNGRRKYTAGWS